MNATIQVLIILLGQLIPAIGNNQDLITKIITALEEIVPVLVKEYQDLVPIVQNIIAALKGTDGVTSEQWTSLDTLEKQIDTEFDQAAGDESV
jgi:hypothetical protein